MEQNNLKHLNDQDLLKELKALNTNKLISATLIGLLLGVVVYSAVKSGFTFFTFFPLFFVALLINSGRKKKVFESELKEEIRDRSLR